MIRIMLDTNICVAALRRPRGPVVIRLRRREVGSVGISSITFAELQYGVVRSSDVSRNAEALARICAPLQIVNFDDDAAIAYGEVRAELERAGTPIGPLDMLIAAHAVALNVPLVTNNTREFSRVGRLRMESWA